MAKRGRKRKGGRRSFRSFARRGGRRAKRSIGKMFDLGTIAKGALAIFAVDKVKSMLGFSLGTKEIDDDIDMILAGLISPHVGLDNSHLVPAGASKLLKDLADNALSGQGIGLGFLGGGARVEYAGGA